MKTSVYLPAVVAAVLILSAVVPARALVNPNFTVVDLHDASSEILSVRVSPPANGKLTARMVKTLSGKAVKGKETQTLVLDFSRSDVGKEELVSAMDDANSAVGVLFVRKEKDENDDVVGSLQIGTTWVGLIRTGPGRWDIVEDPDDLETVWAGSASQLLRAVQYVQDSPSARFPVRSGLSWSKSSKPATLSGKVHGQLLTNDGIVIFHDDGDRVFRPGTNGAMPTDVTKSLGLTSRSRAMTGGDFNGDGKADLASWDGKRVRLVLRKGDGTFAAPTAGVALQQCNSLHSLGGRLVAARSADVAILTPDGKGGLTVEHLPAAPEAKQLGAGGAAVVADLNQDGRSDILHVFEKGLVFYEATATPGVFAKPRTQRISVVNGPADTVCGDYDADGRLDVMVAGQGGVTRLTRDSAGRWQSAMKETGELAAAVGAENTRTPVESICPADLRGDGRQSVAVFSAKAAPGLFYARGFGCFAIAISLTRSQESNDGYDALTGGQQAGVVTDLNGDLSPDLLGVDTAGNVWAALTEPDRLRRFAVTTSGPPASEPVTVSVSMGTRLLGMHVVRPGQPTTLALPRAGKVTLSWKTADGKDVSRPMVVTRHVQLGPLGPPKP